MTKRASRVALPDHTLRNISGKALPDHTIDKMVRVKPCPTRVSLSEHIPPSEGLGQIADYDNSSSSLHAVITTTLQRCEKLN